MDERHDVITARLKLLNGYLRDLRGLQNVDAQTYSDNMLIHGTVERTLQLAVEASLDIGQHIIAQDSVRRTTTRMSLSSWLRKASSTMSYLLTSCEWQVSGI